ncbi:MAG TPA: hypothetical protein VIJ25_16615, partial [Methylococcales bacterium]
SKAILNPDTDCGFCPPLPLGEGWGEGFQKSANYDRPQYMHLILTGGDVEIIAAQLEIKPIVDTDLVLRGLAIVLGAQA